MPKIDKQDIEIVGSLSRARTMYMAGLSYEQIAERIGVTDTKVRGWALSGDWKSHREKLFSEIGQELKVVRKAMIPKAMDLGINLILNSFKHRMDSGEPLTLVETKIVSSVISDIDKLVRLDAGDPTEIEGISSTIPITLDELKKVIARDPFINTVDLVNEIDYKTNNEPCLDIESSTIKEADIGDSTAQREDSSTSTQE
jgi:hypothetical protein